MVDYKLGMKKYDMEKYWNKRAKEGNNIYQKVCVYNASSQFNKMMNKIQKNCLNTLLKYIPIIENKNILEVGCGTGRWAKYMLNKNVNYYGVDISPMMLDIAKTNVPEGNFFLTDGGKLNFSNNYFDLVFTITVLHHIPYDKKKNMIREICRVTKNDGHIIIIEDVCFKKIKNIFNMFPLSPYEWIATFNRYGYNCIKIIKHKFHQKYLLSITENFPKFTNNLFFEVIWIEGVEKLATAILPWKYFNGCGNIFRKI
ncbi:MAG: class I SAM-dependent methyltransferase [Candidatus Hodarchaeota archaeon]